jgi:GxxExxY protein
MTENEISYLIRKAIFSVYNELGPGLFESVYVGALQIELLNYGLAIQREVPVLATYQNIPLGSSFRMDLLVNDKVIVEVKSIEALSDLQHKQLLTYIKLSKKKLGILVNFNSSDIAKSIFRKVNGL